MTVQKGNVSRQRFMENVTLLWTLKEIIEDPHENALSDEGQSWRQLSIQREKTLANVFAFLSATHDDTRKITAVCVEESHRGECLTIRAASNSGDCSYLKSSFEDMAKILKEAHSRGEARSYQDAFPLANILNKVNTKEDDRRTLLRCITRIDQQKILCRLRSRHAARTRRTSDKRSPLIHLREAVQDRSIRASGAAARIDLDGLRVKARELELMFIRLESNPDTGATSPESLEMLSEILLTAHAFKLTWTAPLITALRSSPTMSPSLKEYLPTAMGKLARYCEVSRYLISIARNRTLPIFSEIKVESTQICLPDQPLFQGPFPGLQESWKNIIDSTRPARRHKMNQTIESFLGTSYHGKARNFEARVSATRNVWKVHAEIQLLVYYELNPDQPKPRVIASSKDACYLCNLFVRLHGQFQVSKTHGRIYDRWLLPDWVQFPPESRERMNLTMEQLNASIEKTIVATVRSQKISHSHPNESTLFSIKSCISSTVKSLQLPTPRDTPPASGISHSPARSPAELLRKASNVSVSAHVVSSNERHLISDPNKMAGGNTQTSLHVPRSLRSTSILAGPEEAEVIHRNEEDPAADPETSIPEGHCRSSRLVAASAETASTAATPQGIQEPSSTLSSGKLEPRSERTTEALSGPIASSSSHSDNSYCCSISRNASSTLVTKSRESLVSRPILTKPGQTFSHLLHSATDEAYIQTGHLHLILSREFVSFPEKQHGRDCMVCVKWLNNQEQSRLMASSQLQQITDARDIPKGAAVTVSRGCPPEDGILLSCGPDILVSITYSSAPPE